MIFGIKGGGSFVSGVAPGVGGGEKFVGKMLAKMVAELANKTLYCMAQPY